MPAQVQKAVFAKDLFANFSESRAALTETGWPVRWQFGSFAHFSPHFSECTQLTLESGRCMWYGSRLKQHQRSKVAVLLGSAPYACRVSAEVRTS